MLYKKNKQKQLSTELFKNPTSEYRGAPFWAWNGELKREELTEQIEIFRQMGFGGFHIHVRTGLTVPYLGKDFMAYIQFCVEEAKKRDMLVWLYDEDRWPSGSAGGMLTKDESRRQKYLLLTRTPYNGTKYAHPITSSGSNLKERSENGYLLACFDIVLDDDGYLIKYRRIDENETAMGVKWYAYVESPSSNPWYNDQTYINTLDENAINRFIALTYETYKEYVGSEFDETIPAIFTDEPQLSHKRPLPAAHTDADASLPWSNDLAEGYKAKFGVDLTEHIPLLFWNSRDGGHLRTRYLYHHYVTERFVAAFADNCGRWCTENGIALTGHVMREPTLFSQVSTTGETMRSYRSFILPGIDMLYNRCEYTTAKQAQSAVRQYGREGMLSELYGATGWNFDFAGYKMQGDWQAAMGVTIRVPHLTFLSMTGEAKRDYPASIGYQSPWWREFSYIENHFARLNTALTRGKPVVRVGVVHPVESFWLLWGPQDQDTREREALEKCFADITEWLIFGGIDFDFIAESLLPDLCSDGRTPFTVGKMQYDLVIVPPVLTLRESTLDRLWEFVNSGGRLVFTSDPPPYCDATPIERIKAVYEKAVRIDFNKESILRIAEDLRFVEIRDESGNMAENLLYALRQDNGCLWLFLANGRSGIYKHPKHYDITLHGLLAVEEYDTLTGEICQINADYLGNQTYFEKKLYCCDSLLLKLIPLEKTDPTKPPFQNKPVIFTRKRHVTLDGPFNYTIHEPNSMLLDMAEYAIDDEDYLPCDEILRVDNSCRQRFGYPLRQSAVAQPWTRKAEKAEHTLRLRFEIPCEAEDIRPLLAAENAGKIVIRFNGETVPNTVVGWYVDKCIETIPLPPLKRGVNILEITMPFGRNTNTEWIYLLGNFGVRVEGIKKIIVPMPETIDCGNITEQGFPFYSGKLTYHTTFHTDRTPSGVILPHFCGTLARVALDGKDLGIVAFPPYRLNLSGVSSSAHRLDVTLYVPRTNGFGPVHNVKTSSCFSVPGSWRTQGDEWCYDYQLTPQGIMAPIEIEIDLE
ncbi:MAG: hypothetical protein GX303_02650 [Clostridiales bacterium]|nr:hypothetical protein [Clostridiales bacterium]